MRKEDRGIMIFLLIILSISLGITSIIFLDELLEKPSQSYYKVGDYNITFVGKIPTPKKLEIINIVDSLKMDYALTLDQVTFTNNMSLIEQICGVGCRGFNERYIKGDEHHNIWVYFDNDTERLKLVLCHEILHNIINRGDYYHKFVYDISGYGVCYR